MECNSVTFSWIVALLKKWPTGVSARIIERLRFLPRWFVLRKVAFENGRTSYVVRGSSWHDDSLRVGASPGRLTHQPAPSKTRQPAPTQAVQPFASRSTLHNYYCRRSYSFIVTCRHANWYGLSVSNTDFSLFEMIRPYHVVIRIWGKLLKNNLWICVAKQNSFIVDTTSFFR